MSKKTDFLPQSSVITLKDGRELKLCELSAGAFQDILRPSTATDPAKKQKAAESLPFELIAATVTTTDDESFTVEEARGMSNSVVAELQQHILKAHGLGKDAEADAKNV